MTTTQTLSPAQIMENRHKLAAALRSGEYKQCRGAWKRYGAYCCLGLANELFHGDAEGSAVYGGARQASAGALGLDPGQGIQPLIQANDHEDRTFPEIADMIDALPAPEVQP